MNITYANNRIEKIFTDYRKLQKELPSEWVASLKRCMDRLEAADNFGIFLSLGLGRPEQLKGYSSIRYSIHISANARLIVEPNATQDTLMICSEIEIEGVCDYHGNKENWFIS